MQMTVYDDRHRPAALADRPEWRRWQPAAPGGWKIVDPTLSQYRAEAPPGDQWVELRYQHLVPDPEQWDAILADRPLPRAPRPTLITDFYSYNTNLTSDGSEPRRRARGETEDGLAAAALGRRPDALGERRGDLAHGRASGSS